jgi:LAO/AO transport system kinase
MIDVDKLKSGDIRTLAKAITLIESTKAEDQKAASELLNKVIGINQKSFRLGITGSPGVGKSTFIENFGLYLIQNNFKVAVLAIDPSSPTSGGSILGDKTRMEKLSTETNAFIRPSPTSGALGGVAQKTREAILLCEAAGFDFIIVETVGVGQSEYEIANMVDFFMLLILPSGGDELQGIKKGILELADAIVINKADGENLNLALQTQAQYQSALQITSHSPFWETKVLKSSSVTQESFKELYSMLMQYRKIAEENKHWSTHRQNQNLNWFNDLIKEIILKSIAENKKSNKRFIELSEAIKEQKTSPLEAAQEIAKLITKNS